MSLGTEHRFVFMMNNFSTTDNQLDRICFKNESKRIALLCLTPFDCRKRLHPTYLLDDGKLTRDFTEAGICVAEGNFDEYYSFFREINRKVIEAYNWLNETQKMSKEFWKDSKRKFSNLFQSQPKFSILIENWSRFEKNIKNTFILSKKYCTQRMYEIGAPSQDYILTPVVVSTTTNFLTTNCFLY